jgi:predicted nucleic acid-binding protein
LTVERVLVDTGAMYAFVVRNDEHHDAARAFVRRWLRGQRLFILADVVFAETMTLLKLRTGAQIAVRVGRELRQNPAYQWEELGREGERETWGVFQKYEDKSWSYTDCAMLVLARRLRVPHIFAFDRHFLQMPGVVRLPRSSQ